jgi:tetratricopeptide (TPR) repeat protein
MTGGSQRTALDAVHAARPIVARLNLARDKEDVAADIIEAWAAVETGLRSLVGGSSLTGQMLIRELRQRQFLSLEQANALAEFHAARERAGRTDYTPTEGDINATRDAFLKLETGLMDPQAARPSAVAATAPTAAPLTPPPADSPYVATPRGRPAWLVPLLALVGIIIIGGIVWAIAGRSSNAAYDQGVVAFREGRREAAEASFHKAATDAPNDPMPHVYLARMERERGNLTNANTEAVSAVKLGPNNGAALRELASVLFASQQYDAARTFYIRAIKADSTDRLSEGYLGCSLVRLGRLDEGARWIARAGAGAWSACAPAPTAYPPQQVPGAPRP